MTDLRRSPSFRVLLTFGALLVSLVLLAQGSVGEAAAKGGHPAVVNLGISTEKQRGLLTRGVLRVRVRTSAPTRVRVAAGHAGRNGLFKPKTVRVEGRGKDARKVRLALTVSGERKLASCGPKLIRVTGEYRSGSGKRRSVTTRNLRKDAKLCGPYRPVPVENADRCDFLDPAVCLQPFPNDYFTEEDSTTATGRRLDLNLESMPANDAGVPIDQTDMNRADGFSPGNLITIKIPEVETPAAFENTGFVPIDDLRAYDDPGQPVIVINAETGERQPIWAELDANPTAVDPSDEGPGGIGQDPSDTGPVNLLIRPAENFDFGERYIVALRNLRNADDEPVRAPIGFRVYRDDDITDQRVVEQRRPHMESIIDDLTEKAGVDRDGLYMAWDFTVASRSSVTDRALTIRDDAFARLGDTNLANRTIEGASPDYTITGVDDDPSDPNLTRVVDGTIDAIPCYLDVNGCPSGSEFDFDAGGELTWNPSFQTTAQFRCVIPASVETENPGEITPAVPGTYGHGLLGDYEQVRGQAQLGNESNTLWCAVDWAGFAEQDIATVIASLSDMSNFNKLVDRMQQGFVNFMYLGRALIHPDGMSTDPAFEIDPDGGGSEGPRSVIATNGPNGRLNFMGISQGGIMGGALTALEPDVDRSVLNVPGMNYSTLLRRSVDSDEYFKIPGIGLYSNYPDELERPLLLSLVQLLWDRGEGNGYAHNMTTAPLPDTNPHEVLLQPAIGDHQVANVTAEVEARTIGASVYAPALEPGRHWEDDPFLGIPEFDVPADGPYTAGSMLVYYDGGPLGFVGDRDGGTATPPNENVPPRPEWGFGDDPHGYPRNAPDGRGHAGGFLAGDGVGACASPSGYCFSNGYTGAP